jgi:hypothetical protein
MTTIADIKVTDAGQFGAELQAPSGPMPRHCPGMGGWKRDPVHPGCWITRVKGEKASALLAQIDPAFPYIDMDVDASGNFTFLPV